MSSGPPGRKPEGTCHRLPCGDSRCFPVTETAAQGMIIGCLHDSSSTSPIAVRTAIRLLPVCRRRSPGCRASATRPGKQPSAAGHGPPDPVARDMQRPGPPGHQVLRAPARGRLHPSPHRLGDTAGRLSASDTTARATATAADRSDVFGLVGRERGEHPAEVHRLLAQLRPRPGIARGRRVAFIESQVTTSRTDASRAASSVPTGTSNGTLASARAFFARVMRAAIAGAETRNARAICPAGRPPASFSSEPPARHVTARDGRR